MGGEGSTDAVAVCPAADRTPLLSPGNGRADMAALQEVVGDVFPPYSPPLVTQGRGGGELPPGLKLTEDTTSHKEGWLGTEEGWLGTEEGWLGTEEGWLGTEEGWLGTRCKSRFTSVPFHNIRLHNSYIYKDLSHPTK
jgi:hypothetical protein